MKIRNKVLLAFSVGLVLLITQAVATNYFVQQLQDATITLERAVDASRSASAVVESIKRMQAELSAYEDVGRVSQLLDTIAVYMTDIDDHLQDIDELNRSLGIPESKMDALSQAHQVTSNEYKSLLSHPVSRNAEDSIFERILFVEESLDSLTEESSKLIVVYENVLHDAVFAQRVVRDRPTYAAVGICAIAAILLTLYALYFSAQLTRRICMLAERLQALTRGTVSQSPLPVEGVDELADLADSLNIMEHRLIDVIINIKQGTNSVDSGASEIAAGNQHLSTRTERQAANLVETNRNMMQLSKTVHQNAENAEEADNLASSAQQQAESGGVVVGDAIFAMKDITSASKQIAAIIGVIDDIAFQTNLLALNAAVEAARAGEQGRGFAVVAKEVRDLAQRSAIAAKEIKQLIEDTRSKVDEGTRLVDDTGQKLTEIVNAVGKVTLVVTKIADASRTQAAGIQQVSGSVKQLEEMTQQNAAMVEQAAAASEAMGNQAKLLHNQVSFFEVIALEPELVDS